MDARSSATERAREGALLLPELGEVRGEVRGFGFTGAAALHEGVMWPVSFALKELTLEAGAQIRSLVAKAVR